MSDERRDGTPPVADVEVAITLDQARAIVAKLEINVTGGPDYNPTAYVHATDTGLHMRYRCQYGGASARWPDVEILDPHGAVVEKFALRRRAEDVTLPVGSHPGV